MPQLTDEESHLLEYYRERPRIIHGLDRTPAHKRLLALGYIREQSLELLVTIADASEADCGDAAAA